MGFDGIVTKAVVSELNQVLINSKVNTIYEPNKNEILLGLYNNGKNYALNLCINPNTYRVNLTTHSKPNPLVAPNFCMFLRKHLIGNKIKNITSYDLERIIKITFVGYNELNDLVEKKLIIEIMGKYSNIILVNEKNIVLDSLKHIQNSYRSTLPLSVYEYPKLDKKSFIDLNNFNDFYNLLPENIDDIAKILSDTFIGISHSFINYIVSKLNIVEINRASLLKIYEHIKEILQLIDTPSSLSLINISNNDFTIDISKTSNALAINFFLDDFYFLKEEEDNFKNYRNSILKILLNVLKKLTKRLENIDLKLKECEKTDIYKLYGELITANLYKYKDERLESLEVQNYYDNNNLITIPLDISISVASNANKYFKKYNKLKNTYDIVTNQKRTTQKELYYIQSVVYELENASSIEDVDEIYNEISDTLLFKSLNNNKIKLTSKKKENAITPIQGFLDDYKILVGKNNKQNDYLTFKLANKNDIWFHAKDIHGSHVILKSNGKEVKAETLLKCASIAAYHSKGKNSTKVLVDYTFVKYVKKPGGAKPGMVTYTNYMTLNVKPKNYFVSSHN